MPLHAGRKAWITAHPVVRSCQADKEMPQKDCLLFVIDANHRMANSNDGAPSTFKQALRAVVNTMQERILGGDSDLIGVLLYGTVETKVPNDHQGFPHIYMLQELEVPSAEAITKLNRLVELEEPPPFGHLQARGPPPRVHAPLVPTLAGRLAPVR